MSPKVAIWGVAVVVAILAGLALAEAWLGRRTHRPLSARMGFKAARHRPPLGTEALDLAVFHKESRRSPLMGRAGAGSPLASQTAPYRPQSPNPFERDAS